jgi:hypothetical protein
MKNILLFIFAIQFGISSAQVENPNVIQDIDNSQKETLRLSNQLDSTDLKIDQVVNKLEGLFAIYNELVQTQTAESKNHSDKIQSVEASVSTLEKKGWRISKDLNDSKDEFNEQLLKLNRSINDFNATISSLTQDLEKANISVTEVSESTSRNRSDILDVNQSVHQKQLYGIAIIVVALFLLLVVYIVLSNKWNIDTKKINTKQNEIFEKQIQDSLQLSEWLESKSGKELDQSKNLEPDHSFAKRVADEIVRMRTNLSRMDESIKGFKQLSASVRKLEQSLNANQYELEDLLNKPYHEGMNLQANFVEGENLKEDESVITKIIKPQINYKGKVIQAAQVEVSQGF